MNKLIEELLLPLPGQQPCGPDLSVDPQFDELETILKGKPEVDIGTVKKPAEPPEWRELRDKSAGYLRKSKHLRVAMMFTCSLLQTGGLDGFRDGLQLIRGLLEQFWASLYPLLDPEDNNDPTQRLNILSALNAPRGSILTGWLTIHDYLYAAPLCQPKGAPPVSFDQLKAAKLKETGAEGAPPDAPSLSALGGALRAAGEQVAARSQALQEALEAAEGIDQFLTNTLTAGNTMSFEELTRLLKEMIEALKAYLPGAGAESGAAAEAAASGAAGESPGLVLTGIAVSGTIRSRDDVVRAIDSLCRYYEQVEPGSPVPYLLRRAQKLATMNFLEAMQELNLATADTLRPSMGSTVGGEAAPAPPPAS